MQHLEQFLDDLRNLSGVDVKCLRSPEYDLVVDVNDGAQTYFFMTKKGKPVYDGYDVDPARTRVNDK